MHRVVIVDPRGLISRGGNDVIMRHEKYGLALRKLVPNSELVVISVGPVLKNSSKLNLSILCFGNAISMIKAGVRLVNDKSAKTVLVCGDPWESFYIAKVICFFAQRKVPIQIQIHADVGSAAWRLTRLINRFRYILVKIAIRQATQVRFVSHEQRKVLERALGGNKINSVVIPVPIYLNSTLSKHKKTDTSNVLALVGRLEIDRGIDRFLRIVSTIEISNLCVFYWIIGTGSKEKWLKSEVSRLGISDKFTFFGEVSQQELSNLWPKIGCLISLAPSESYGRAVREALLHGVPVLARTSSGLLELEDEFSGNGLVFIEDEDNEYIVNLVRSAFATTVPGSLSQKLADDNELAPKLLAKAWVGIFD